MPLHLTPILKALSNVATVIDAVKYVKEWWDDEPEQPAQKKESASQKRKYKPRDSTKFTQWDFDIIMDGFEEMTEHNRTCKPGTRITQEYLTKCLNERLGLDKSIDAYARVYRGQVERDSLATGPRGNTNEGS